MSAKVQASDDMGEWALIATFLNGREVQLGNVLARESTLQTIMDWLADHVSFPRNLRGLEWRRR